MPAVTKPPSSRAGKFTVIHWNDFVLAMPSSCAKSSGDELLDPQNKIATERAPVSPSFGSTTLQPLTLAMGTMRASWPRLQLNISGPGH